MQNLFRTLGILILFLAAGYNSFSQTSPVQVGVVGIPPYPTHIGDFGVGTADHIKLQLLLTDLGATRTVWLRMKMSGPSLNIQTTDAHRPTFELVGGVPVTLGLADLASFFNIDNISGTNPTQFAQPMAEGVYFICFEVFDNITNAPIGNNGCLNLLSTKNEPPMLTMPMNKAQVVEEIGSTQNLILRWTPRHIGMGLYQYKFRIARVMDSAYTPQVWLSTFGPDYLINDVLGTMLQLNTGTYPLVPGAHYAWQVQVYGLVGTDTMDNFENTGNSEIWSFTYDQQSCTTPQAPWATKASASTMLVHWDCDGTSEYSIRYKPTNGDQWYYAETTDSPMLLTNLKPLTEYEISVGIACSDKGYLYSSSISATTLHDNDTTNKVNCGIGAGTSISNWVRKAGIIAGQTFKATDFTIYVDSVVYNTTDTTFTGHGHLQIKHLYFANVKVAFEDIGVNKDGQLIYGKVNTTWDPNMGNIMDMGAVTRGGTHAGDVVTGDVTASFTVDVDINSTTEIEVKTGSPDADGNPTGDIKIGGQTFTAAKLPTSIVDPKGRYYGVDKSGIVKQVATTIALPDASVKAITSGIDNNLGTATFSAITNETIYALDNWRTEYGQSVLWGAKYEDPNISGLKVGSKCMAPGVPDVLKVTLSNVDEAKKDKIKFITPKGICFTYTRSGSDYTVNLLGGRKNDAQELYVTIDNGGGNYVSIGKLKLASYEPKTIKVAIVPVGSASIPSGITAAGLQMELNKIYNPFCINVKVRIAEKFEEKRWDNGLTINGSTKFSNVTNDMDAVADSYKKFFAKGEYTIFVISKFIDTDGNDRNDIEGDMPRGSRYGFLNYAAVTSYSSTQQVRLCGHELSHGVFNLKHSFDGYWPEPNQQNYVTDNLMNYGTGITYSKFQWDCLHDPALVIGMFENDDDGMSVRVSNEAMKDFIVSKTLTFITPSGQYVTVPEDAGDFCFSVLDRYVSTITGKDGEKNQVGYSNTVAPLGSLISFTLKEKTYSFRYNRLSSNDKSISDNPYDIVEGLAYFTEEEKGSEPYKDIYSKDIKPLSGIAAVPVIDQGKIKLYISRFKGKYHIGNNIDNIYSAADNIKFAGFFNSFWCFNIDENDAVTLQKKLWDVLEENKIQSCSTSYVATGTTDVSLVDWENYVPGELDEVVISSNKKSKPSALSVNNIICGALDKNSSLLEYFQIISFCSIKSNELQGFNNCVGKEVVARLGKIGEKILYDILNKSREENPTLFKNTVFKEPEFKIDFTSTPEIVNIKEADKRIAFIKDYILTKTTNSLYVSNYQEIVNFKNEVGSKSEQGVFNFLTALYPEGKCGFVAFDIETRCKMLSKLAPYDNYWVSGTHNLIADLIKTTPPVDRSKLLVGLSNNDYTFIRVIWNKLTSLNNQASTDVVANIFLAVNSVVSYCHSNHTYYPLVANCKSKVAVFNNVNPNQKNETVEYAHGVLPFIIGLNAKMDNGNTRKHEYKDLTITTDIAISNNDYNIDAAGVITLKQNYSAEVGKGQVMVYDASTNTIKTVPENTVAIDVNFTCSPFELVPVTIVDLNGSHNDNVYATTEQTWQPAFMAMFLHRNVYVNKLNRTAAEWRKATVWALTVGSAFFSGGTSLLSRAATFTTRLSLGNQAAMGLINRSINRNTLSPNQKELLSYFETYAKGVENIAAYTAGADMFVGTVKFLASGKTWNKFGEKMTNFADKTSDFYKKMKEAVGKVTGAGDIVSKGGKIITKEISDIVDNVFSNSNKLNHLIEGSTNSVHRWETLVPDKNSADILDIVKETLKYGTDELYNGVTLTKVADVTRNGITKQVQITYAIVNGKITPSNGWVKL